VDSQIISLKASGADIFFNVTTPKFAAQAIKKAGEIGWKPVHLLNNVSQSVGSVLKPAGLENAQGILSSYYLKDPSDPQYKDDPGVKEWVAFMDKYMPDGDKTSSFTVYGYAAGQTMVHVLKQCGDNLTRENVMKQAASINDLTFGLMLPGMKIKTGADDYFPIQQMQMQRFNGERWAPLGPLMSGELGAS
jgi:branched-chain amino acid transport system substrate-binding protein